MRRYILTCEEGGGRRGRGEGASPGSRRQAGAYERRGLALRARGEGVKAVEAVEVVVEVAALEAQVVVLAAV